jgi:hypothetical protein
MSVLAVGQLLAVGQAKHGTACTTAARPFSLSIKIKTVKRERDTKIK